MLKDSLKEEIKKFIQKSCEMYKFSYDLSKITNQVANPFNGYHWQNLISLATETRGKLTGGRGQDLENGDECKECSSILQP